MFTTPQTNEWIIRTGLGEPRAFKDGFFCLPFFHKTFIVTTYTIRIVISYNLEKPLLTKDICGLAEFAFFFRIKGEEKSILDLYEKFNTKMNDEDIMTEHLLPSLEKLLNDYIPTLKFEDYISSFKDFKNHYNKQIDEGFIMETSAIDKLDSYSLEKLEKIPNLDEKYIINKKESLRQLEEALAKINAEHDLVIKAQFIEAEIKILAMNEELHAARKKQAAEIQKIREDAQQEISEMFEGSNVPEIYKDSGINPYDLQDSAGLKEIIGLKKSIIDKTAELQNSLKKYQEEGIDIDPEVIQKVKETAKSTESIK